jgi:two-component system sensor histidine kinase YesM
MQVSFSFMEHIAAKLQSNEEESILLLDTHGNQLYTPIENDQSIKISEDISTKLNTLKGTKYFTKDKDYYFFQELMNEQIILLKVVPEEVMMVGAVYIGQTGIANLLNNNSIDNRV